MSNQFNNYVDYDFNFKFQTVQTSLKYNWVEMYSLKSSKQ